VRFAIFVTVTINSRSYIFGYL